MSERPAKYEVGQRWRRTDRSGTWRVTAIDESRRKPFDFPIRVMREDDGNPDGWKDSMGVVEFLGYAPGFGPTPTPGEGNGMEAGAVGFPLRCLGCDGDKTGNTFYCDICIVDQGAAEQRVKGREEWRRGARDFPRPARPAAEFINCTFDRIGPGEWRLELPPMKPLYGRMVGEMRDASGAPLSALQAVQARKPPEPYVCPVDDWDLLPDAGR